MCKVDCTYITQLKLQKKIKKVISCQWYTVRVVFSFFFLCFSFCTWFLHLVKVCIVMLIVFSVCTFCTNGDNNNNYFCNKSPECHLYVT